MPEHMQYANWELETDRQTEQNIEKDVWKAINMKKFIISKFGGPTVLVFGQ